MGIAELHVRDDQFPIPRTEPRERRAVAGILFLHYRLIERGRFSIDEVVGQRIVDAASGDSTMLVADAVLDRLTQIRRQRATAAKIQSAALPKRAECCVLDEIGRVGRSPGPVREPAVRPARQRRKAAANETAECGSIADARLVEQPPRRGRRGAAVGRARRRHGATILEADPTLQRKGV